MNKLIVSALLIGFSTSGFADSANQYVLGQSSKTSESLLKGESSPSAFVSGSAPKKINQSDSKRYKSHFLKRSSNDVLRGAKPDNSRAYNVAGTQSKSSKFIKVDSKRFMSEVYDRGNSSLRFSYLYDEYDVSGDRGVYNDTFGDDDTSDYGNVFLTYSKYIYRNFLDFSWAVSAGVGHKSGPGTFASSRDRSSAEFKLWMVPVDAHLGVGLPMTSWAKLAVSAGPSVLTLLQSRDDFEDSEDGKRKNQFSYGYSASTLLQISLARMFEKDAHRLHNEYELSQMYFNFEARYQSYSNFQDEALSVEGLALGGSISFEFL